MESLTELFCLMDDFCRRFEPAWQRRQLTAGTQQRRRRGALSLAELMTLVVLFHQLRFRQFKRFYLEYEAVNFLNFPHDDRNFGGAAHREMDQKGAEEGCSWQSQDTKLSFRALASGYAVKDTVAGVPVPSPSNSGAKTTVRKRLCARAWNSRTHPTLAVPRTRNWFKPRFRARALTHSAVAARSL